MKNVIKRNGVTVDFDSSKITNAIRKANAEVADEYKMDDELIPNLVNDIVGDLDRMYHGTVTVEQIQDLVEESLVNAGKYQLAKAYIVYRFKRSMIRQSNTTDHDIMTMVRDENKEMREENSNKSTILASTQRDYIAGIVSRDIANRLLLPKRVSEAHQKCMIHYHDADYALSPEFNCCLVNIGDMLDNGTCMNGKMVESPKSFQVACTVATQIMAAVASNQYGGQSIDMRHFGKYLRRSKDKFEKDIKTTCPELSDEEVAKLVDIQLKRELSSGVQTIQYQINTLFTSNGQSPFVTLFLYLDPTNEYAEENAMIIEEILKQRLLGIKNECGVYITPAFPKLIYVLTPENNLSGGKYDYITELAIKCTAKRMYPDYVSEKIMKQNQDGNVYSYMGCRSLLPVWKDENGTPKFEGRFNQGVVSINLPQIGIIANGDEDKFWKLLDERLDICFEALMFRHKQLKNVISDNSPIHWQYGAIARLPKGASIEPLLYGSYSSISLGYIGLYETCIAMKGVSNTDPVGKEFAMRVITHLRDTCTKWKEETNIGFSLYSTPAESLCYRFARYDKEHFGNIEHITDKGWYTNSYHVTPTENINAFDKLDFEAQFQPIASGGHISYVEIPNLQNNLEAIREVVKYIYNHIQYAEFNTKSDYCQVCGYDGEIKVNENNEWECPQCHNKDKSKMNVIRRTCGYLGENFWNEGKTKEIASRVMHL